MPNNSQSDMRHWRLNRFDRSIPIFIRPRRKILWRSERSKIRDVVIRHLRIPHFGEGERALVHYRPSKAHIKEPSGAPIP